MKKVFFTKVFVIQTDTSPLWGVLQNPITQRREKDCLKSYECSFIKIAIMRRRFFHKTASMFFRAPLLIDAKIQQKIPPQAKRETRVRKNSGKVFNKRANPEILFLQSGQSFLAFFELSSTQKLGDFRGLYEQSLHS